MDVAALATSMALSNTATSVTIGVMKDAENLQEDLVARLFGSMGIGNGIDAYA
jgi:hypothetical protein